MVKISWIWDCYISRVLADLAVRDPGAFSQLVGMAKQALPSAK